MLASRHQKMMWVSACLFFVQIFTGSRALTSKSEPSVFHIEQPYFRLSSDSVAGEADSHDSSSKHIHVQTATEPELSHITAEVLPGGQGHIDLPKHSEGMIMAEMDAGDIGHLGQQKLLRTRSNLAQEAEVESDGPSSLVRRGHGQGRLHQSLESTMMKKGSGPTHITAEVLPSGQGHMELPKHSDMPATIMTSGHAGMPHSLQTVSDISAEGIVMTETDASNNGHSGQQKLARTRGNVAQGSTESHIESPDFKLSLDAGDEVDDHGLSGQQRLVRTGGRSRAHNEADLQDERVSQEGEVEVIVDATPANVAAHEIHFQPARSISSATGKMGMAFATGEMTLGRWILMGIAWSVIVIFVGGIIQVTVMKFCMSAHGDGDSLSTSINKLGRLSSAEPREPFENMKIDLIIRVKNATSLPALPGVIDPYVEISCVMGDPRQSQGGIYGAALAKERTHSKRDESSPQWNETLKLSKVVHGPEYFINIVLWQSNDDSANSPLAYHSVKLNEFISGLHYDPAGDAILFKDYLADKFLPPGEDVKSAQSLPSLVNLSVGYLEVHKFTVSIDDATSLPTGGRETLDSFVEIRILRGNPRTKDYHTKLHHESNETVWHGRTRTVRNSNDPVFNDVINFTIAADTDLYMLICVIDSGTDSGVGNLSEDDTPLGMVILPVKDIMGFKDEFKAQFSEALEKLPTWNAPEGLGLARLSFGVSHKVSVAKK
jgi:hypothetical protein